MLLILQHILWYNDNPCWYLSEQSIILLYDITVQQSMHSNLKTFIFSQACEATFNMALLAWLNKYCLPYTSCYLCLYLCTWFVYANDSLWNYLWSCYHAQLLCHQQLYWHKQIIEKNSKILELEKNKHALWHKTHTHDHAHLDSMEAWSYVCKDTPWRP